MLPVFRIGLPSAVDRFYKTVQLFVINKVLLAVSSGAAIAAFADINTLNNVFNSVVMGFGASTLTMAGVFVGEGDRDSLKALFRLAVKKTLLSTGALAAAVFLAAPLLIDILVLKGETGSMRVRDACRPFAPKRWLELHRGEDPARNIGIRTICSIAEEVRYSRTLGLDYLLIRL